jgi:LytS/YehU family sensor histidine kinase
VVATVVLLLQRRADRRYERYLDRPWLWFAHHLKWLPLIALGFITSIYAIRHGIYALVGKSYRHESWAFLAVYESVKLVLYLSLWLGVIFGLHSFSLLRSQRQRLLALQKSLAESQLSQLRAQLHPHFLFNALNTVSSLMHADVDRADRLLARLGDLLRITLQSGSLEMTSLQSELKLLALYADVMQERFPDRVSIHWQIPPDITAASVPSLLLQPLLENAFKHGVERCTGPVKITIAAQRHSESLRIAVRNSGSTLAADRKQGVGLRNCHERLRVIYGSAAKLELTQRDTDIEAAVELPFREHLP